MSNLLDILPICSISHIPRTTKKKQARHVLNIPAGMQKMDILSRKCQKDKVVIVMGATGTGKSRLSIDIATQVPAEIVNSDKMQVYKGLDIVTNKINEEEKSGIPHHLLGVFNPNADFTATNFRDMASLAVESISTRGLLPVIVGGSNSYIEALVDDEDSRFRSNYDCCFLWVDVSMPVLRGFVCKRVDQMVSRGMVDEVRNFFEPNADYSRGIRRSIGVPELDRYLRLESDLGQENCARLLHKAVQDIKNNTCNLTCRQLEKIHRLMNIKGWNIHRIDATEAFCKSGKEADEAWQKLVVGPSIAIVGHFLYSNDIANKVPAVALETPTKDRIAHCLA
uniref:adenylate dimethylallyltransferase (ADP/ATP-dependent) n=1 Tax=Rhizophora mucronata TaxID=61149 RepID=A0A2P2Q644_RHIMU